VPVRLRLRDLKALFYVKDYFGNRDYKPPLGFGSAPDAAGAASSPSSTGR